MLDNDFTCFYRQSSRSISLIQKNAGGRNETWKGMFMATVNLIPKFSSHDLCKTLGTLLMVDIFN